MMRTCWLAVVQMMLDQRTREGGVEPAGNSGKILSHQPAILPRMPAEKLKIEKRTSLLKQCSHANRIRGLKVYDVEHQMSTSAFVGAFNFSYVYPNCFLTFG